MGLQVGDILVRLGHYPTPDVGSFQKWLYMHGVGYQVKLRLVRGAEVIDRSYEIEERPKWAVPR